MHVSCFVLVSSVFFFFFFKQKTAYEMRISDWSSDVCSSDLLGAGPPGIAGLLERYDVEGTRVWGVFHSDVLAGVVALSRPFHLQRLDVAFLWGLFVYQRYRGTATSRLLIAAAIDCCEPKEGIELGVPCLYGGNLDARRTIARF